MDLPSRSRVHDRLPCLRAKHPLEVVPIVLREVVPGNRLPTVLVHPLKDLQKRRPSANDSYPSRCALDSTNLVTRRISETGEEREELGPQTRSRLLLENNLVQLRHARNLALVAHQPLRNGVHLCQSSVSVTAAGGIVEFEVRGAYWVEHHQLSDTGRAFTRVSTGLFSKRGPITYRNRVVEPCSTPAP